MIACIASYARRYAELGLVLTWVPNGEKGPRHRGWNDPVNAIDDPVTAREFWKSRSHLGIAALLEPSRLVSLDVDDEVRAAEVLGHFGLDLDHLRANAPTITGRHFRLMFRSPDEVLRHRTIAWPKQGIPGSAVILELRAGLVADTLPPSKHPTAGEYRWTRPPRDGFPPLPHRLLELWRDWDTTQRRALELCPWYVPPRHSAPAHRHALRPRESVIEAFNAAHDPAMILEAHDYTRTGRRFASPATGHAAGIVELDDGRLYCHHQGDPLATGHALDAFDVYRILDHRGDWRSAVRAAAQLLGMNGRAAA
jgi:putative DNA primase/helicase